MKEKFEKIGYIGTLFYGLAITGKFNGSSILRNLNENIGIGLIIFASLFLIKKFDLKKLGSVEKLYLGLFILIPIFLTLSPVGIDRGLEYIRRLYKFTPIFLCPLFLNSKERIKKFIFIISVGLFIYSLETIYSYELVNWNFTRGYESITNGVGYSAHALTILSFLPLTLTFLAYKNREKSMIVFGGITYILVITCVLLGQRRGAWLGLIIPSILYVSIFIEKKYFKKIGVLLLLLGMIFVVIPKENNVYYKRFISIRDIRQASPSIRLVLWKASYEVYKKYPVFGIGDKEVAPYYTEYFEENKEKIIKETSPYIYSEAVRFGKKGYIHSLYFASIAMMGSLSFYFFSILVYSFISSIILSLKLKKEKKEEFIYSLTSGAMNLSFLIVGLTELAWYESFIRNSFLIGLIIYISITRLLKNK